MSALASPTKWGAALFHECILSVGQNKFRKLFSAFLERSFILKKSVVVKPLYLDFTSFKVQTKHCWNCALLSLWTESFKIIAADGKRNVDVKKKKVQLCSDCSSLHKSHTFYFYACVSHFEFCIECLSLALHVFTMCGTPSYIPDQYIYPLSKCCTVYVLLCEKNNLIVYIVLLYLIVIHSFGILIGACVIFKQLFSSK